MAETVSGSDLRTMSGANSRAGFAATAVAALSMLSGLEATPALAEDARAAEKRSAALTDTSQPMSRLGAKLPNPAASADLDVLLVQYRPAYNPPEAGTEVREPEDTILVALVLSAPETVEADIASTHNLELVDRTNLPALGLRVIRFRIGDSRPAQSIIATLLRDPRIERAQVSVTYRLPTEVQPPVASRPVRPQAPAAVAKAPAPRPAGGVKTHAAVTHKAATPDGRLAAVRTEPRIDVGDVISGGL